MYLACLILFSFLQGPSGQSSLSHGACLEWIGNQSINLRNEPIDQRTGLVRYAVLTIDTAGKYQIEFCVENTTRLPLQVGLVLGNWFTHEVSIYHFHQGKLLDSLQTGSQVPNALKAFPARYHQIAPLVLPPRSKSKLVIIYRSHRKFPVEAAPILMPLAEMIDQLLIYHGIIWLCFGALLLMLFYGLVMYMRMGNPFFLFYNLHLIGAMINLLGWSGGFGWMLGNNLTLQIPLVQIVILTSWVFYLLFLINLLPKAGISIQLTRFRIHFISIGVITYLLCGYFYFYQHNLLISSWLFLCQGLLFALVVIYISIRLFRETKTTHYFFLGSIFLAVGVMLNIFLSLLFPNTTPSLILDPNLLIPIALVLEIASFTIGLSERFKTQEIKSAIQKARIQELLEQKESILNQKKQEALYAQHQFDSSDINPFIQKCIKVINQQIKNNVFSVTQLADTLCLSRVQLYRRLKSEIGMSASEMIRWVRVSYSANLLKSTDLNISEVSYEVGFNNLSYFASCFRKQYGINPSDYKKKFLDHVSGKGL